MLTTTALSSGYRRQYSLLEFGLAKEIGPLNSEKLPAEFNQRLLSAPLLKYRLASGPIVKVLRFAIKLDGEHELRQCEVQAVLSKAGFDNILLQGKRQVHAGEEVPGQRFTGGLCKSAGCRQHHSSSADSLMPAKYSSDAVQLPPIRACPKSVIRQNESLTITEHTCAIYDGPLEGCHGEPPY